jgi:hypothetical protein
MLAGKKVTFHKFTRDKTLKVKWIAGIRRDEKEDEFQVTDSTRICSRHFVDDDFTITEKGRKFLKKAAIPSIFQWSRTIKERKWRNITEEVVNEDNSETPTMTDLERLQKKCDDLERELSTVRQSYNVVVKERDHLKKLYNDLMDIQRTAGPGFGIEAFKDSKEDMCFYTGFPSHETFKQVLRLLDVGQHGENIIQYGTESTENTTVSNQGRKRKLSVENEYFLVLIRLRLGLFELDLAHRFQVSMSTVNRICISWINYMFLKLGTINIWPSQEKIQSSLPALVKEKYPNLEWIIDAFEISSECPSSLYLQSQTYSNYKSTNTVKGLLACTAAGHIGFISQLYTGSLSDRELVERCGFMKLKHNKGAMWMVDKGFLIHDLAEPLGVTINMPKFVGLDDQMLPEDVVHTQEVASQRIHIERAINKVKNFHIFDRPIPISMWGSINQIWAVCSLLTLFQNPIISA